MIMKKLSRLILRQANIDQSDILKKKQMRNIWGGRIEGCDWCCTIDKAGNCKDGPHDCGGYDDCWKQAVDECGSGEEYGIRIRC